MATRANMRTSGSCASAWLACAMFVGSITVARADEGVWTFDHPPTQAIKSTYGFDVGREWLDALRLSAVRVGGGASGAFVSTDGLVLTNHHVALSCTQELSTASRDFVRDGFVARSRKDERTCPGYEVRRLESFDDVTDAMRAAVSSTDEAAVTAERNIAIARLENDCSATTGLRCEVVTLYRGAVYQVYRYRVWTDVRLVIAPEARIGFFGGDADNFVFPRFDLDFALLRVYDHGQPLKTPHHLRVGQRGLEEGDVVFAAGHPYSTDRLVTLAQLEFDRDARYPWMIASAKRQRQLLQQFAARSAESRRRAAGNLFGTENWLKSMAGEYKALQEVGLIKRKAEEEAQLRAYAGAIGDADPWKRIETTTRKQASVLKESWVVGYGYRTLFGTAGHLVELANERALPDGERLAKYRDSEVPTLVLQLTQDAPIYKDLEIARVAGYWQEALDTLGADHPFVKRVLGGRSPLDAATAAIEASKLDRVDERKRLVDGGLAAVNASSDPLIVLARSVYPLRRRLAKFEEVEIDTPIRQGADAIGRLRFKRSGTDTYPDATGTLRLSYGAVRGYDADGTLTPWRTNFWGLYARSAAFGAQSPFDLPATWVAKQRQLALGTPLNFVSTLDIIGGSSGSPVVDRDGALVGLIFDGNLEALAGRYVYTDDKARAIAVDARAIVEALTNVYGVRHLVDEMTRR